MTSEARRLCRRPSRILLSHKSVLLSHKNVLFSSSTKPLLKLYKASPPKRGITGRTVNNEGSCWKRLLPPRNPELLNYQFPPCSRRRDENTYLASKIIKCISFLIETWSMNIYYCIIILKFLIKFLWIISNDILFLIPTFKIHRI